MRRAAEENNARVDTAYNSSGPKLPFSDRECDRVVRWAEERAVWNQIAEDVDFPDLGACLNRFSYMALGEHELGRALAWLPCKIANFVESLNNQIWRFNITGLSQLHMQRFDAGDQVSFHKDLTSETCNEKLAVILQLSGPTDYEGGVFEYGFGPASMASRERGAVLVFPTWAPHRIRPVTSGRRYAIACFALGPSFR